MALEKLQHTVPLRRNGEIQSSTWRKSGPRQSNMVFARLSRLIHGTPTSPSTQKYVKGHLDHGNIPIYSSIRLAGQTTNTPQKFHFRTRKQELNSVEGSAYILHDVSKSMRLTYYRYKGESHISRWPRQISQAARQQSPPSTIRRQKAP